MFVIVLWLTNKFMYRLRPTITRNLCSILLPKPNHYGLVMLNPGTYFNEIEWALLKFWDSASVRILADGASNNACEYHKRQTILALPDAIVGDMDSALPSALQYFHSKGVDIVRCDDQDTTDFTKAITHMVKLNPQGDHLLVLACCGGRIDHMFGILNTMYLARSITKMHIYILFGTSLITLLPQGKHELICPVGSICGLVPLAQPVTRISTVGLQWDLDDRRLEFGGLVSTSNRIITCPVLIDCSHSVLWTMEVDL